MLAFWERHGRLIMPGPSRFIPHCKMHFQDIFRLVTLLLTDGDDCGSAIWAWRDTTMNVSAVAYIAVLHGPCCDLGDRLGRASILFTVSTAILRGRVCHIRLDPGVHAASRRGKKTSRLQALVTILALQRVPFLLETVGED